MSIPTFNAVALCSAAAVETLGAVDLRLDVDTMPGVDGEYVQFHGRGGRTIEVRGVLSATGATPAAAHQALKALLAQKQALADAATVATYVGTDSASHTNCLLQTYQPTDAVAVNPESGAYRALQHVTATLRQLAP